MNRTAKGPKLYTHNKTTYFARFYKSPTHTFKVIIYATRYCETTCICMVAQINANAVLALKNVESLTNDFSSSVKIRMRSQ
jgi:hypothetical protein